MGGTSEFGTWLKKRRKVLDLTQEQLSSRADCSIEMIRKLESGRRRPSLEMVHALAKGLAVSPEERQPLIELARLGTTQAALASGSAKSQPAPSNFPSTLPRPLTTFVGRHDQLRAVCDLLRQDNVRLLTLTGPGGSGKTRLAVQAALAESYAFQDGAYFVSLASLQDASLVESGIARTLRIPETPGGTLVQSIAAHIGRMKLLLVLDNFEHLLGAAPLLVDILSTCPNLHIMVTSRERLHVTGEHSFPVPPLEVPEPGDRLSLDALLHVEAVNLFVQRAALNNPGFSLFEANADAVSQICAHLDGLPLAIELAAARVNVLSPQAMLARIEHSLDILSRGPLDLPLRQQTLRNTMEWSYTLLSDDESAVFRRMAAFSGGCTLRAIQSVCILDEDAGLDVLEIVSSLTDKSLLKQEAGANGEVRFTMLTTLQEYALEKLELSEETDKIRARHALYFLALAEEGAADLEAARKQEFWLDRLDSEHNNVRAALDWLLSCADPVNAHLALRLAGAMGIFWYMRGNLIEGRRRLAQVLAVNEAGPRDAARAKGLLWAGNLAYRHLDPAGKPLAQEALGIYRELRHKRGIADALRRLGSYAQGQGNFDEASSYLGESLALAQELADRRGTAETHHALAQLATNMNNFDEARAHCTESLKLYRELDDKAGSAVALNFLGTLFVLLNDYSQAQSHAEAALSLYRELNDAWGICTALSNLGDIAYMQGDYSAARAAKEASAALLHELGAQRGLAPEYYKLGRLALHELDAGRALEYFRLHLSMHAERGTSMLQGWQRALVALCLADLGQMSVEQARGLLAATLYGAAAAQLASANCAIPTKYMVMYEAGLAAVQACVEPAIWREGWLAGQAMTLDEAIAYGLDCTKARSRPLGGG